MRKSRGKKRKKITTRIEWILNRLEIIKKSNYYHQGLDEVELNQELKQLQYELKILT